MKLNYFFERTFTAAVLAAALGVSQSAFALTNLDLTIAGSSGFLNGGFFQQVPDQSTGTGVIDPFVRLQAQSLEEGYNSSLNDVMPDVKTGTWTHDILLGAIPVKNVGGTDYYQVLLDINQNVGGDNEFLSLNKLQIFLKSGPLTSADEYSDLTSGATKVWDLDIGGDGDSTIKLDYSLNNGSGSGDMFAYIPVSAVGTDLTKNFYLYSSFGDPNATNDGFEEWAVVGAPSVPDGGATVLLLGAALSALGLGRRFLIKA